MAKMMQTPGELLSNCPSFYPLCLWEFHMGLKAFEVGIWLNVYFPLYT